MESFPQECHQHIHRCGQEGDTSIARRNWVGLKRFIDNEIHRATQNSSLGLRNMFVEFGDWISQPGPVPGGADTGASGAMLATFSFVKDLGHFVEIAEALGKDDEATHYRAQLRRFQQEFRCAATPPGPASLSRSRAGMLIALAAVCQRGCRAGAGAVHSTWGLHRQLRGLPLLGDVEWAGD